MLCLSIAILQAGMSSAQVRAIALETEEKHLALITNELNASQLSLFLPLWKLAGYLTGAMPSYSAMRCMPLLMPWKPSWMTTIASNGVCGEKTFFLNYGSCWNTAGQKKSSIGMKRDRRLRRRNLFFSSGAG